MSLFRGHSTALLSDVEQHTLRPLRLAVCWRGASVGCGGCVRLHPNGPAAKVVDKGISIHHQVAAAGSGSTRTHPRFDDAVGLAPGAIGEAIRHRRTVS